MTRVEFQPRVEWVLAQLEAMHDRVHPLRAIPIDLVTSAIMVESPDYTNLDPPAITTVLNTIIQRNNFAPSSVLRFTQRDDDVQRSGIFDGSSHVPHEGASRLRDGG